MARFLAKYRNYSHGARSELVEHYATGRSKVLEKTLEAQFLPEAVTDHDKQVGLSSFGWKGLPEDRDTGGEVSPIRNLSLFDSERARIDNHWTDEEHDIVVKALRESTMLGVEFIECELPKPKAPWAGYDKLESPDQIAEIALATETPIDTVLAYERAHLNREDVIEVLSDLQDSAPAEDAPVVIEA